jgi:hypothetical protein
VTVTEQITIDTPGVYDMTDEQAIAMVTVSADHVALIESRDLELVSGYRWYPLFGHNGKIYVVANVKKTIVYMHRLIAGTPKGLETDHVNGDGLDNRRGNLRTATCSLNSANTWKPARPDGSAHTSKFKGVSWDRARGKWQSKINPGGGTKNLGRYRSEEDAARAYDAAAVASWGEFARLNFPDGGSGNEHRSE